MVHVVITNNGYNRALAVTVWASNYGLNELVIYLTSLFAIMVYEASGKLINTETREVEVMHFVNIKVTAAVPSKGLNLLIFPLSTSIYLLSFAQVEISKSMAVKA